VRLEGCGLLEAAEPVERRKLKTGYLAGGLGPQVYRPLDLVADEEGARGSTKLKGFQKKNAGGNPQIAQPSAPYPSRPTWRRLLLSNLASGPSLGMRDAPSESSARHAL